MTRLQRFGVLSLCAVMAAGSLFPGMLKGAPGDTPAAQKTRAPGDIVKDLKEADAKLHDVMPSLKMLADADFVKADGAKALTYVKQMLGYFAELKKSPDLPDEAKEEMESDRLQFLAFASVLGDEGSTKELDGIASGKGALAADASATVQLANWLKSGKDEAKQNKILDAMTELGKANPKDDNLAATLAFMSNVGAANDAQAKKAMDVIRSTLTGRAAQQAIAEADAEKEQKDMIGKPLALLGRTSTGGTFSSTEYKGKVVMLDFWATWCGPCIGELPNVKKAYTDYHDKGFEIIGLSCDSGDAELNDFTAKNGMTWVQLRETSQDEKDNWHPLAKKYHVLGIPQMFLIDKKGVLRYVDAREDLEKKIKELVEEK